MAEKDRWDKKFNLYLENKSWISKIFDERDEKIYPYEGDLVVDIFRNYRYKIEQIKYMPDEVISPEQQKMNEIMKEICNFGYLCIIEGTFACIKNMWSKGKIFRFRDRNNPLSIDAVRKICDGCKKGEQYDKELTSLRTMFIEIAKEQGNEIYPYDMYLCIHPDVKSWRFTFFKMGNLKCYLKEDKEVIVNKVCLKCEYIKILKIYIPLKESPKYNEFIKRLEDLR